MSLLLYTIFHNHFDYHAHSSLPFGSDVQEHGAAKDADDYGQPDGPSERQSEDIGDVWERRFAEDEADRSGAHHCDVVHHLHALLSEDCQGTWGYNQREYGNKSMEDGI